MCVQWSLYVSWKGLGCHWTAIGFLRVVIESYGLNFVDDVARFCLLSSASAASSWAKCWPTHLKLRGILEGRLDHVRVGLSGNMNAYQPGGAFHSSEHLEKVAAVHVNESLGLQYVHRHTWRRWDTVDIGSHFPALPLGLLTFFLPALNQQVVSFL